MKRYQCNDFELPNRRPWTPPGCCPPQCPPQCPPPCPPPMPEPCPPQPPYPPQPPCPPLPPCNTGCVPTPWVLGGIYRAGQLVTYNGFLYVANVDNASGVPGGVSGLYPAVHAAAHRPHRPCRPHVPRALLDSPEFRVSRGRLALRVPRSHGCKEGWTTQAGKTGKKGKFGALLMQNIPYNRLTSLCAFF